jgi:hypothetical protein
MDDYENKNDHDLIISKYNEFDILSDSCLGSIFSLFTIYFLLQKISDNLMAKWQACFYPMYLLFIILFLKYFIKIIYSEVNESKENESRVFIRITNIERVVLISNFFKFVYPPLFFLIFYNIGEFLDRREDIYLFYTLYVSIALCLTQIIYSFLRRLSMFDIKVKLADGQADNEGMVGFISSVLTPILTYCSNAMIVCSSSGVCTQVYMSTIASLLGAFGVTLSDFSEYLLPITIVLLGVSLVSLYIKKKSLTHKPFLLGVFASGLIMLSHVFDECSLLIWPGNLLMIGAAIWNARLNKFYGLPRYVK